MNTRANSIFTLLLAFIVQLSFAQTKTISGNVSDETGPLPGVSIVIKGTTSGTESDFDGNYAVTASVGDVLEFSFVGMTTQEMTVGAESIMNLVLASDNVLDEVVITAFGKKKQKRSLGYAATAISNDELTEVNNSNPFESLSGKIAGVDITSPAQPGASTKVVLRGFSSLSNNSPLYVVDGTPISSENNSGSVSGDVDDFNRSYDGGTNINDLDPNNIENINILKGGPAAALYGSRASNGAIIITTKKGKAGQKIKVDINSYVDFSEVSRVPHLQNEFGQGWNGYGYSSLPSGGQGASNENGSWGPLYDGKIRVWGQIANNAQQMKPYVNLKNNVKDFYDIGNTFTNSMRLSGGGEKTDFSISYSGVNSDGIIPTDADAYRRKTLGINTGLTNDKFAIRVSANYAQTRQNAVNTGQSDNAGEGNTLGEDILQVPRDVSVVDLEDYTNNIFNTPSYYYTPYSTNPYFSLNENATNINRDRLYGNINLSYKLSPNLTATLQAGGDFINGKVHSHGAIDKYIDGSPNNLLGANETVGGVTENTNQSSRYENFFTLDYDTEINDDFSIDATLGATYTNISGSSLQVTITDLDIPDYYEISNSANPSVNIQNNYRSKTYSAFAATTLSFKERIFLNLTGRNEWTSTLSPGNNSYFYPSANISGIAVDNGKHFVKVRMGYAQLANGAELYKTESIAVQAEADAYFGSINFPFNGINSFEIGRTLGNKNIKPEFTDEYEVGIEGRFFNSRITTDISLYRKVTTGAILEQTLANSTGYGFVTGNFIDLENQGIELALGIVPIQTEDFRWNINYTFTKNEGKVLKLPEGIDEFLITGVNTINFYAVEGRPLGVFKTRVPEVNEDGQTVVDANTGYPTQTLESEEVGTSQRKFIMGLQNTLKYKNFRLSFGFDWKEGGIMFSRTANLLGFVGNSILTTYNQRNPFIVPNSVIDNGDGTYSENTQHIDFESVTSFYSDADNPSIEPTTSLFDKSFIRLRDLSLAYSFPTDLIDPIGLDNLTVSIYGKNLMLWTPDDNPYVDPEISTFGADIKSEFGEYSGNPAQRSYGFALKVSF